MTVDVIEAPDCYVAVRAEVSKRCPVKDEVDYGTVRITWRVNGETFELHALADYLQTFTEQKLSHEAFTVQIAADLNADVSSTWETKGMTVTCSSVSDVVLR